MRKILLAALGAFCVGAAFAQTDTLVTSGDMRLRRGENKGELLLEVGGYGVTFGQGSFSRGMRNAQNNKTAKRVRWGIGFSNVEFGFSLLSGADYTGYAGAGDFFDQRVGKSIHFGFRFLNLRVALSKNQKLFLRTGVHLMCDNYTFSENITLQKLDGRIEPVALDKDYRKSKLATASLGIPVQFSYYVAPKLSVSALVYGDVVFNSHTKYKKPDNKARLSGVNVWQCGVGATISYKGFGLYCKYGLTPLFRSGVGPKVHPLTVGLYF